MKYAGFKTFIVLILIGGALNFIPEAPWWTGLTFFALTYGVAIALEKKFSNT